MENIDKKIIFKGKYIQLYDNTENSLLFVQRTMSRVCLPEVIPAYEKGLEYNKNFSKPKHFIVKYDLSKETIEKDLKNDQMKSKSKSQMVETIDTIKALGTLMKNKKEQIIAIVPNPIIAIFVNVATIIIPKIKIVTSQNKAEKHAEKLNKRFLTS